MTKVIVDSTLRGKLQNVTQPVELCDESGAVLGQFLPAFDSTRWESIGPPVSEEELDRRAKSDERTYSTAEVLARLETL